MPIENQLNIFHKNFAHLQFEPFLNDNILEKTNKISYIYNLVNITMTYYYRFNTQIKRLLYILEAL